MYLGESPKVTASIWAADLIPEPGWSPACPTAHTPGEKPQREGPPSWPLSVKFAQVKASRWSEQTHVRRQSSVRLQMPCWERESHRSQGAHGVRKSTELVTRILHSSPSPHSQLLPRSQFLLLAEQPGWTKSPQGSSPTLKSYGSCEQVSGWCRKESQTLLRKSLKP